MLEENEYLIFVVENNKIYNRLVTEYLKRNGFPNVKSLVSGEECVQTIEEGIKPDIIIQDYSLDGINGLEVLKQVKKISPHSEFIFLTSNENMEVAVNTIKFGAFDYIVKDKLALEKVVYKMRKITSMFKLQKKHGQTRKVMYFFLAMVAFLVILAFFYFVIGVF
ncbi:response regulator [Maribellus comscasis]|uniref:Response regulator n=1 Tax=Maribellus comscasis TaxID=2681766 RepID=A0A6I6JJX7_9BACT|nr:response regulator [Maribellus comscasis]QGY43136.1 response regulator [Maribellus comscasis]